MPTAPGMAPPKLEADPAPLATAELAVGGMHCSACATRIQKTLGRLPAVASASVNLATTRAFVSYDPAQLDTDQICSAVSAVGYSAAPVVSDRPERSDPDPDHWVRRAAISWPLALAALAVALAAPESAAAGDYSGLRGAIGTPDQLRRFLRRYEEAGVDQLIFVMQAGHNRHEDIMESLELFGTQVLPEFVERDEAGTRAKAARWEPLIQAALARRDRRDPVMAPDYVIRAIPKQMVEALDSEPARQWLEDLADKRATGQHDEEFQRLVDG